MLGLQADFLQQNADEEDSRLFPTMEGESNRCSTERGEQKGHPMTFVLLCGTQILSERFPAPARFRWLP